MFQHRSVLARTQRCDHQSLSRLAQGKGALVVLHRVVHHHAPIYVVAEGSWFRFARVCTSFPQRSDVIVGQIHIIAEIHCPKVCLCPLYYLCHNLQVSANTAALQRTDLTPKGKQRERSNQNQRAQRSVQIPKVYSLTGI